MKSFYTLLLITFSLTAIAQNNEKNFIDQNYVEVTGTAFMEVVPDLIYINIVLKDKENKNKLSLAEIEVLMFAKMGDIGIDVKKDLAVRDFTGNLKEYWFSKPDMVLMKQYQLTIHETATLQKAFLALQGLGITEVSIERLDHSQIEKFRNEVKVNAIKAAKDKAQSLTSAIGQTTGRAIYIQEMDVPYYQNEMNANVMFKASSAGFSPSEDTNLDFEKIRLNSSILVRFELK
jgi:uncharacterized protein